MEPAVFNDNYSLASSNQNREAMRWEK
jgi:hypothetical protein